MTTPSHVGGRAHIKSGAIWLHFGKGSPPSSHGQSLLRESSRRSGETTGPLSPLVAPIGYVFVTHAVAKTCRSASLGKVKMVLRFFESTSELVDKVFLDAIQKEFGGFEESGKDSRERSLASKDGNLQRLSQF